MEQEWGFRFIVSSDEQNAVNIIVLAKAWAHVVQKNPS